MVFFRFIGDIENHSLMQTLPFRKKWKKNAKNNTIKKWQSEHLIYKTKPIKVFEKRPSKKKKRKQNKQKVFKLILK